jgi:hypothetical protein
MWVGFWSVETAVPSPKFQLQPVMVPPVSVDASVNAHDRLVQFDVNAATGVLGGGDAPGVTSWVTAFVEVLLSSTVSVTCSVPDPAYVCVTVGLDPVTTGVPSPKFQLYVTMTAPMSVVLVASKEHDRAVQFDVNAAVGVLAPIGMSLLTVLTDVVLSVTVSAGE